MSEVIELSEIIDALDCCSGELQMYLDKSTGELFPVTEEDLARADDVGAKDDEDDDDQDEEDEDEAEEGAEPGDLPDWQGECIAKAREILADEAGERYLQLPDQFEIDEQNIMLQFGRSIEDAELGATILGTIYGPGSFRRFKDLIRINNLEKKWQTFRRSELRKIAVDWCEQNDIKFKE